MYTLLLILHSLMRWVVLAAAVWALVRAYSAIGSRRAWTPVDASAGRFFTISLDVQFLIGIVLYGFLSPITSQAFSDMGAAMRDPVLRFWAVEHIALMVAALALAHIGRSRSTRGTDASKHRTAAIFFTLSLLFMLLRIPWPFMAVGRPLLRLLG